MFDDLIRSPLKLYTLAKNLGRMLQLRYERGEASGYASLDDNALVPRDELGTGTADSTTFLRGDGTWDTPSGGSGDVVGPGSSVDNAVVFFNGTTGKLVQDFGIVPSATSVPNTIPISDGSGYLTTWIEDSDAATKGVIQLTGALGGTAASPSVVAVTETSGPTDLTLAGIVDGQYLKRSGTTIIGDTPSAVIGDADYGDVTVSSSGTVWTIDPGAVSNSKLRDSAAASVIGRSAATVGAPADIATTADFDVLQRSGTTLGFQAFRVENRTSDPGAPAVGQMWLRTDL